MVAANQVHLKIAGEVYVLLILVFLSQFHVNSRFGDDAETVPCSPQATSFHSCKLLSTSFCLIICYSTKWIVFTTGLNTPSGYGFNVRVYITDETVRSTCKSCWLRLLYNHLVMGCEREISYQQCILLFLEY